MFVLNIFLALAWVALTGRLSPENLFAGFVMGYAAIWLTRDAIGAQGYVTKVPRVIRFSLYFLGLFARSSWRIAVEIVTPRDTMKPAILAIPLDASTETEILILTSLITLTPGSLTLDVSSDRRYVYVHEMYMTDPEQVRKELKDGLEKRLLEVLR
jgi:multicomponent Na+:H+ antiporter subunit E